MNIKRNDYIRTTATRMASGMLAHSQVNLDILSAPTEKDVRDELAEAAFMMAESMADQAELRGYAPWESHLRKR